jgi:hypothetical protein
LTVQKAASNMGTPQVDMEGVETEASPSADYVVVPKPGTVFIEARIIITQDELDIHEVRSIDLSFIVCYP